MNQPRMLAWFSCGAASAVAAKVAVDHYSNDFDVEVLYCDTSADEHPDNARFFDDVQDWLGVEIKRLQSDRYQRIDEVFRGERYIVGPYGAACTRILKKRVRMDYQRPSDVHVLGYTADEQGRIDRFESQHKDLDVEWVLADRGISKKDCYLMIERAGIELPAMYRLGYHNANCIGCVKGGMGYWNKIRRDFPERFAEMSRIEREVGAAVNTREELRDGKRVKVPVYLDELDPEAGRHDELDLGDCGVFCESRADTVEMLVNGKRGAA